jgi:hypothetical protein
MQRYIIMPRTGFDNPVLKTAALMPTAQPVAVKARAVATTTPKMRVLDSIGDDGPKLVEMSAEGELSLRLSRPELKIVPEVFYYPQWFRPLVQQRPERKAKAEKAGAKVRQRSQEPRRLGLDDHRGQPLDRCTVAWRRGHCFYRLCQSGRREGQSGFMASSG